MDPYRRWTVTVKHGPLQEVDRYGKTWTITGGGPLSEDMDHHRKGIFIGRGRLSRDTINRP